MRALSFSIIVVVLALLASRADAYPQFQLTRDTTCNACHISATGGGLLNENGLNTAEGISTFGTAPEFMYGKITTPSWLSVGGDFRGLSGFFASPQKYLLTVPMQADLYGHATYDHFAAQVTLGYRPPQDGNRALTTLWAREHYLTWESNPGEREGIAVRVGHFMPIFGLRLVEHPTYIRRFGGTPLFGETYAAAASVLNEHYEVHVTGFIKDPTMDPVVDANGAAAYGEVHLGERTLIGGGGMFHQFDWKHTYRAALTAKHYLPTPNMLVQAEAQFVYDTFGGNAVRGVIGILMASYWPTDAIMVDLALNHYDPNLRVLGLDRDAADLNIHWFATSHLEAMLVSRLEVVDWSHDNPNSGWVMAQVHYRL
jgi:hypothetical protein